MPEGGGFDGSAAEWLGGLGLVRDTVRQELVRRQLLAHLPPGRLDVLDAGCGQGTQAIVLARLGHRVTGLDSSEEMLESARVAAGPVGVRFLVGDVMTLEVADQYDVVCCHGVAMYLPDLGPLLDSLLERLRPGGVLSLLTRNRFGIAMRAGMTGDWIAALAGFDARHYDNRIGVKGARADEPAEVTLALERRGAKVVNWYGVRLFTDHWGAEPPPADIEALLAVEQEAGRRDPYRSVAALTHTIAVKSARIPGG